MNKLKRIKALVICVVLIFILSLGYYNVKLRDAIEISVRLINNSNSKQKSDSLKIQFFENNLVQQLENSGINLDNVQIEDFNSKTYHLKELIKGQAKLIFMFSELNCQTCIDMQLPNIEQLSKDIGAEKIILLASYSNKRDLVQFARINNIKLEIYNYCISDIKMPLIESNVPFFFILNPNLTSTCLFIPEKSLPKYTTAYLNIVKHRFFNQQNVSVKHCSK